MTQQLPLNGVPKGKPKPKVQQRSFKVDGVLYHNSLATYHTQCAARLANNLPAPSFREAIVDTATMMLSGERDDEIITRLTASEPAQHTLIGLNVPMGDDLVDIINALASMATLRRVRAGVSEPRVGRNEFLSLVLTELTTEGSNTDEQANPGDATETEVQKDASPAQPANRKAGTNTAKTKTRK